jgi:hypothetical protein
VTEEQAKRRFLQLTGVRFISVLLAFTGIANIGGKLLPALAPGFGLMLVVFGALEFFLAPIVLKRIWQKQDQ